METIEGLEENHILINKYPSDAILNTDHHNDIVFRASRTGKFVNGMWENYPTQRYAFEVYIGGYRLFSKIKSRVWPNIDLVSQKCLKAWNEMKDGNDLSCFETNVDYKLNVSQSFESRNDRSSSMGPMSPSLLSSRKHSSSRPSRG